MYRTARRYALSGIAIPRVPRGGWHREDPGDTGEGRGPGHDNGEGDTGKAGDNDSTEGKPGPKIEGDFDQERHARALAAARESERKAKEARKASDDRLAAVLKAAGLTADGKTDPAEQLKAAAAERDKATAKARETAIELAVYKSAGKAGADPDAILDSRGFLNSVAELDPDAADFRDKVTAAIKDAVKANPKLAATDPGIKGAVRQGADHSGAGAGTKTKPKGLAGAVTAALSGN
ncbi:hypothetical protein [Actinoplanes aureus]|uniref:Scaffolding protein n=1 Tax=Actinoplanes aureus TaxID=2792083 RepID=A0A931BZZ0_9ACTN|nr:hypothetical protein [Actinoplanes aureus]MBG0560720.1 hypothetical protein [Actinoplanes aureus]